MSRRGEGEATFEFEGKTYTLVVDFNALIDFEEASGCGNAMERLQTMADRPLDLKETRALIWCLLRARHPEVTERDAGALAHVAVAELGNAIASFAPEPDAGNVVSGTAKAPRRTRAKS